MPSRPSQSVGTHNQQSLFPLLVQGAMLVLPPAHEATRLAGDGTEDVCQLGKRLKQLDRGLR